MNGPARAVGAAAVVIITSAAFPATGTALTYDEHCRISNAALGLAVRFVQLDSAAASRMSRWDAARLHMLTTGPCSPRRPTTYGDLVALADFALSPVEYYAYRESGETLDLVFRRDEIPWRSIEQMAGWRLQNLRAAHLNDDHFEERAILSHYFWHEAALHMAVGRRRLRGALVLGAFADHFLQDLFAPGHIRTPRRRLHDVAALGRHDGWNRKGGRFHLEAGRIPDLVPFLELADSSLAAPCRGRAPGECLAQQARDGIPVFGDGGVHRSPEQHLLLVLLTARSVADVLHAFYGDTAVSHFREATWQPYRWIEPGLVAWKVDDSERAVDIRFADAFVRPPEVTISYGRFVPAPVTGSGLTELAAAVTAGHQTTVSPGGLTGAVVLEIEALAMRVASSDLVAGGPPSAPKLPSRFAAGLAYRVEIGEHRPRHGASARVMLPLSELNSQVSFGGSITPGASINPGGEFRYAWECRVEMGFGLGFMGIGIGRDHGSGRAATPARWIVRSTFSLGVPLSSLTNRARGLVS